MSGRMICILFVGIMGMGLSIFAESNLEIQLKGLKKLKDDGLISAETYQETQKKLMEDYSKPPEKSPEQKNQEAFLLVWKNIKKIDQPSKAEILLKRINQKELDDLELLWWFDYSIRLTALCQTLGIKFDTNVEDLGQLLKAIDYASILKHLTGDAGFDPTALVQITRKALELVSEATYLNGNTTQYFEIETQLVAKYNK